MMGNGAHIELDRAIDAIEIGQRHRRDLGDIAALAASIERVGLLHPPTITPDGVLVCGRRRLEALRTLGQRSTSVWVRSGISDRLSHLLAEQDENTLRKPLSPIEAAALYRELKQLLAEDATRRQEASRFTADRHHGSSDGAAESAAPSGPVGDSRAQAAQMVTGRRSYTRLEQVNHLQQLAEDPDMHETVRSTAKLELDHIRGGAPVDPAYHRVRAAVKLAELDALAADPALPATIRDRATREAAQLRESLDDHRTRELHRLADDALARARTARRPRARQAQHPTTAGPTAPAQYTLRAFLLTWDDLAGWWNHYDPADIGPALTTEQWERFDTTVSATVAFADQARAARCSGQVERASA